VALTGAGVSVPSGIPDFRSPGTGLWGERQPDGRRAHRRLPARPGALLALLRRPVPDARDEAANGAHHALVELERRGHLDAVVTQNIDRLHRAAGTQELIEVHGTIDHSSCLTCGQQVGLDEVRARLAAAPDGVPRCDQDHPLKPGVVLFGEFLPEGALEQAFTLAAGADVLLCIGSSLEVYPIAQLPALTRQAGGAVAIVTQGETPYDSRSSVRLGGDVVAELEALVAALDD
jgi:NAD-dependent deacetylase